jgi:hypothetical protein
MNKKEQLSEIMGLIDWTKEGFEAQVDRLRRRINELNQLKQMGLLLEEQDIDSYVIETVRSRFEVVLKGGKLPDDDFKN